ncbi:sir2 family histone deacetylase [Diplocarpon rosae]|nr:sir2 family histone deacetylase [Diplocarpon rosae]
MSSPTCSSPISSPLTSVASRSPTPVMDYPSPPCSDASEKGVTSKTRKSPDDGVGRDPPAKRQRIFKKKELKTEYLDMRKLYDSDDGALHADQDAKVRQLLDVLRTKRRIVVIAGAGISVSAGIPDFRSSTGLFSSLRTQHKLKSSGKELFDASVYRNGPATSSFHDMVRELSHQTQNAKPTPFHHMLATIAEEGRLMRLYTQNVDGIDTSLPPLGTQVPLNPKGPWPKTVQLHGGLDKMMCSKCGHLSDFEGALFSGPEAPLCPECETIDSVRLAGGLRSHGVGRLRPRMVLYNEFNPDGDAIGAVSHADLKRVPDAVIVVGTTLKIPGTRRLTRELCAVTRARRGGFTAWINLDPEPIGTDLKDCWDMVVRAECDEVATAVGLPKWDDKDCGDYSVGSVCPPDFKLSRPQVVLKKVAAAQKQGIKTPTESPKLQSSGSSNRPPKLKQAPLSFAPKPAEKLDVKKKAGRSRKPLPSKPTPAGNRITTNFGATKVSKAAATKPIDALEFPGLSEPPQPGAHDEEQTAPNLGQVAVEIPYNRYETISPPGRLPSGMSNLLN